MRLQLLLTGLFLPFVFCSCQPKAEKKSTAAQGTVSDDTPSKSGTGQDPRYYVTTKNFGLVNLSDTYADIEKKYGRERITDEALYRAPESDEQVTKTIINKGKPDEIIIQWDDNGFHTKIMAIETGQPGSVFITEEGISCGSALAGLVKLNGAKISFNGFGWGFGGMMTDFHGGKLSGKEGAASIRYDIDLPAEKANPSLLGEQQLNTDMPIVQQYLDKIRVSKITLYTAQ